MVTRTYEYMIWLTEDEARRIKAALLVDVVKDDTQRRLMAKMGDILRRTEKDTN